ncbi:MAG TPA: fused MFS/spermidine synthase [Actinomycetales bacterium]|nr:fused MFS/spermidine synthase [Actinomycetales bacterium]
MFYIDGMESSYVDLDHPEHLEFEYMQHADVVVSAHLGEDTPLRALHLGGGACALARAWDATHPGSAQLAVEWDPEIARLVRTWFPLPRSPRLRIRTEDARAALDAFPASRWDVVVRDVFVAGQVPAHLRDETAWAEFRRVLAPGGVVVTNVADSAPLEQARTDVAGALRNFTSAVAIADPAVLKGRRYGNVIVAAAAEPLDAVAIARRVHGLPMPARVMHGAELYAFARV